jgi:hypothetical protein
MEEPASFEARAVLEPGRARRARFALLVPAVAFVAIAAAAFAGSHSNPTTDGIAGIAGPTALDAPSSAAVEPTPADTREPRPQRPAAVFGMEVHRLDEVQMVSPDAIIAVVGWYTATGTTACPPLAAQFVESPSPVANRFIDAWAYCQRSGVLYASPPEVQDSWSGSAGLGAIHVEFSLGVVAPAELEAIASRATEVVVLGRFVGTSVGCDTLTACQRELLVDYVAWTPDA